MKRYFVEFVGRTYPKESVDGRVDSGSPCVRKEIVVGVGKTRVLNEVLEVTVRTSTPRLRVVSDGFSRRACSKLTTKAPTDCPVEGSIP